AAGRAVGRMAAVIQSRQEESQGGIPVRWDCDRIVAMLPVGWQAVPGRVRQPDTEHDAMSSQEMQRLAQDLRQPGLRDTLGTALQQSRGAEDAAAMLQRAGYDIEAQDLQQAAAELSDQALDQVAGGLYDLPSWWGAYFININTNRN
ncbi:Nif11-like leader peptide family RiPP precursor, partial [Teichococcus cervicalis]